MCWDSFGRSDNLSTGWDSICDKIFKNGPSEIGSRQPLKIWSDMVC